MSVIEHLTGVAADDPDPWLEVEAVVVDESNFLSGQHWRRLQLVVTCPATGKVYTSASPVAIATTSTRSSSSSSSPGNNNSRISGRYSSRTTSSSILQDFTSWLLQSSSPPASTKLLDSSSSPPSSTKLHTKRIIPLSPSHSLSYIPVVNHTTVPVAANSLIATSALLADEDDEDAAAAGVKNTHLRLLGHPQPSLRKGQTASSMSECSNDSSLTLNSMRQALESNPNTVAEGLENDVLMRDDGSDAISDDEEDDDDVSDDDNDDNDGDDDDNDGDDNDDDEEEEEGRQRQQQELKGMARDGTPHISCSSLFLSGGRGLHNRRLSSTVCNVETEMEMEEIDTTGD